MVQREPLDLTGRAASQFLRIGRGGLAIANVVIRRRLLFIPRDSEASSLGKDKVELSSEYARSTGGCDLCRLVVRGPFLSNNHLNDKVVLNFQAVLCLDITGGVEDGIDHGMEFDLDLVVLNVCLPAVLDVIRAYDTSILVENAFAFTTNLGDVLRASRGDELGVLLNAPVELAQLPTGGRLVPFLLDKARHTHLDIEVSNGVDDVGKGNGGRQVGGREDANRVLVIRRQDSTLNGDGAAKGDGFSGRVDGLGSKAVLEVNKGVVGRSREVAGDQVAEGKLVLALIENQLALVVEGPLLQFGGLRGAVGALLRNRLLGGSGHQQLHLELVDGDVGLSDVDLELTGENGAGGVLGRVVQDNWWRFDDEIHLGGLCGLQLGGTLPLVLVAADQAVALESIHVGTVGRGGALDDLGQDFVLVRIEIVGRRRRRVRPLRHGKVKNARHYGGKDRIAAKGCGGGVTAGTG